MAKQETWPDQNNTAYAEALREGWKPSPTK